MSVDAIGSPAPVPRERREAPPPPPREEEDAPPPRARPEGMGGAIDESA